MGEIWAVLRISKRRGNRLGGLTLEPTKAICFKAERIHLSVYIDGIEGGA